MERLRTGIVFEGRDEFERRQAETFGMGFCGLGCSRFSRGARTDG
jgi:hypothetical protein